MGTANPPVVVTCSTSPSSSTSTMADSSGHAVPRQGINLVIGWTAVIWLAIFGGYVVCLLQPSPEASSVDLHVDAHYPATQKPSSSFAWIWPNDGAAATSAAATATAADVVPPIEIPDYASIQYKVGSVQQRWLHPDLFPLTVQTIVGFGCSALALMIAAGGGIGGGGVLVPIYILIMGFSPKYAIPLSNVTILGGAVANMYLNLSKRHPFADRPLVDWDLILIMEPVTIAGALMGAMFNKLLPTLVLTLSLVLLLGFTAKMTFRTANRLHEEETCAMAASARAEIVTSDPTVHPAELITLVRKQSIDECADRHPHDDDGNTSFDRAKIIAEDSLRQPEVVALVQLLAGESKQLLGRGSSSSWRSRDGENLLRKPSSGTSWPSHDEAKVDEEDDAEEKYQDLEDATSTVDSETVPSLKPKLDANQQKELEKILEYERHTPVFNVTVLMALFVVVLALNLLKGGGAFPSPLGIECGSFWFWFTNFTILLWIFAIVALVRWYLMLRHDHKVACGYEFVPGDVRWNARSTVVYPLLCCVAGFCSGMFGIGGGIVKGPLMLALGVHPAVSSATAACMILFTSFTATTSYIVFGLLIQDYAVACLLLGFVATYVGQVGLGMVMDRTGNRYSYIAYLVAVVVVLSAFLMTAESLLGMNDSDQQQENSGGGICGVGE